MHPLATNQRVLTWLCGLPPHDSEPNRKKIAYIVFTLSIVTINIMTVTSSTMVIYRSLSISSEKTVNSLYQAVGSSNTMYQSIATVLLRHKLAEIFVDLSKIYNENEQEYWTRLLKQINDKCEWIWKMYFKYILIGFLVSTTVNASISVVYCYSAYGHFVAERAFHPFEFLLPWNQSTLLGYSLKICFDIISGEIYFLANGSIVLLFISMCLHHQSFFEMFRNEAQKLNYCHEHRNDAEHLHKMISFHITVKDWFLVSAEAYSAFILIQLISSMLFLACYLFQLDLQMKHLNFEIVIVWIGITMGISILFAYCYCGRVATESYERMADCLYECNWFDLNPKLQKCIIVMITNIQRPICYHGFGIAVLNLQTFTNMIRAVVSYYMMFKTLTSN